MAKNLDDDDEDGAKRRASKNLLSASINRSHGKRREWKGRRKRDRDRDREGC